MSEREPKSGEALKDFAWLCIRYADRHGTIVTKRGDDFASGLSMTLDKDGLKIDFTVFQSPHSNGSLSVIVAKDGETVLEAKGKYVGGPRDVEVTTYVPGEWEDVIRV